MKHVWIGLAGAAGALSRYLLGSLVAAHVSLGFPLGTFLINVTGSFLLGLLSALGAGRGLIPLTIRTPITVGFVGAYTTFSTWSVDTVQLLEHGDLLAGVSNIVLGLVGGMLAVWVGFRVGHGRDIRHHPSG